jgi:hypothetical protein
MTIAMTVARQRLAAVWFGGFAAIFLMVLAISLFGAADAEAAAALWSWFLPTVMPSLSLIAGMMFATREAAGHGDKEVERFQLGLATWFSAGYLAVVAVTLLASPFFTLADSHLWLAPLQGLASAMLGMFFAQRDANPARNRRAGDRIAAAAV